MTVKHSIFALLLAIFFASCSTSPTPTSTSPKKEQLKTNSDVVIDSTMTLKEFAKANNMTEPYLRKQLNMPTKAGAKLPLYQLKKTFKFTDKQLIFIVENARR